jgi:hypothetical protein
VSISSSNSPRFEPNPNSFPDRDVPPVVAHQTISLGGAGASYILLPEIVADEQP